MVIFPLSDVISPSIFPSIIMSLEKRMEPTISIPVERTLVAFAMVVRGKQMAERVATGNILEIDAFLVCVSWGGCDRIKAF